jgi:YesN/AraC family two-component response regulator
LKKRWLKIYDLQSKFLIDLINNSFLSENEKRHKAEALNINKTPHFTLVFRIIPNENCIDDEAKNRFLQSIVNFLMLIFKDYSPKALVLNSKTICLVVHLSDQNSNVVFYYPEKEPQTFTNGEHNALVERAKEFIRTNYMNKIELQDIANHVHLNPSYLSRTFKRVTGDSIVNYITKYRIEKSKELLTSSDCKLCAIAEKVGISDTSYFSNIFKKITGYSPSEFKFKFSGKNSSVKNFEDTLIINESDE